MTAPSQFIYESCRICYQNNDFRACTVCQMKMREWCQHVKEMNAMLNSKMESEK